MINFLLLASFSTLFAQMPTQEEEITYDWLISQSPRGGYTDHIPHFRELFEHYKVKTLLEFGMGYSTKYFLNHLSKVISVEFVTYGAGPTWLHELLRLYKNDSNWVPIAYLSQAPYDTTKIPFKFFGSDALYKADAYQCSTHEDYSLIDPSYLKELNSFVSNLLKCHSVDCAFVDSGTFLRGDLVSLLFSKVAVIVAHDTHPRMKEKKDVYGYSRVVTPPNYEEIYIPKGQGTTIWIQKDLALEPLIIAMKKYAKRTNDELLQESISRPYPLIHRSSPYYTHQPLLYEISKQTNGPIIEFGCGDGSTDLLHEVSKQNKRLLVSLDDDEEWLSVFKEKYKEDDWHQFIFVSGKPSKDSDSPQHWIEFMNQSDLLKSTSFDVCFIDQHPWLARLETIKFMKEKARFIILHDCDYFPTNRIFGTTIVPNSDTGPGVFDFSDVFRHFKVYPASIWPGPPTLLGSDIESTMLDLDFNAY